MRRNKNSKIILFYSPQGGSGKSTLAVNTAILASTPGTKVLLVDMSVYGSVMSSLRIPQKGGNGLSAVLTYMDLDIEHRAFQELTEVVKNAVANAVVKENLDVLISSNPVKMESMGEKYIKSIMDAFRNLNYDYILIDTSSELSVKNLIMIEQADKVIVPLIQDISCGWKMMLFKEITEKYLIGKEKIEVIINKCCKYSGFNNMEFEAEIGFKTLGEIPYFQKKYQNYINEGRYIDSNFNKKAYKCFQHIKKTILNDK